jgi:hypothetical protein
MTGLFRAIYRVKVPAIGGLAAGAALGAASVALAATSYSSIGYTPRINGHVYETQSIMYTIPTLTHDEAETDVWTQGGETVGTGWIGINARKFVNGSLCNQTGYQYNTRSTSFFGALTAGGCGSGVYYSYGTFDVWNGGGYDYYYSQKSPSLNG